MSKKRVQSVLRHYDVKEKNMKGRWEHIGVCTKLPESLTAPFTFHPMIGKDFHDKNRTGDRKNSKGLKFTPRFQRSGAR